MATASGSGFAIDTRSATQKLDALFEQTKGLGDQIKDIARLQDPVASGGLRSVALDRFHRNSQGLDGGFKSFQDFAHAIRIKSMPGGVDAVARQWADRSIEKWGNEYESRQKSGEWAPRVKANSPLGMNESFTGSDGGYLVPPEFVSQVLMRTYANDLLSRCTVLPIGGNSISVPAINETSRADGSRFGGVRAYWRREAATVAATKPSVMEVNLQLESLMLMVRTTSEVLEDTGGVLETLLTTISAQELAFVTGDALVNGDGVGKPLGILKSPALITVTKDSGQASGTITANNVLRMWSRLHPSAMANAVWLYDQTMLPALAQTTIGTAGANLTVWLPPGGLSAAPYGTLLGRPMIPSEFCQPLGTLGDLILCDWSQVLAATKGGVQTAVSMHLYFDTNEMAFRFILRMDAKPWWISPLAPKNGGPTQSFAVVLETR